MIQQIIPFTCAICGAHFSELRGGKCVRCGKVVCRHHFLRGWWKGWSRVCSKCVSVSDEQKNSAKK
jgi:hypothetical protein